MAQQKKRPQGTGRTPNSEPRIQTFKEFNGVNFEHVGYDQPDEPTTDAEQTDLQMNFTFLQNNVMTTSNKSFATRDELVKLFEAPEGVTFTGPAKLIGPKLYIARHASGSNTIGVADLDSRAAATGPQGITGIVSTVDQTSQDPNHTWSCFGYYDDKLIALTEEDEIWVGDLDENWAVTGGVKNARQVPNPTIAPVLTVKGSGLTMSDTLTNTCPFRVMVSYTYVNKFGPTKESGRTIKYFSKPPTEWHSGCYVNISVTNDLTHAGVGVQAVELYYTTDNAVEPIFLGRTDAVTENDNHTAISWSYNWYGYIDATNMWSVANLVLPTENYTQGVHASRMTVIDGRLYFWGDTDNPQRLYMGGNPGNLLSVSPGTGGGFVDVEPGTSQAVRHVCKYKTQSGNSIVTMLCSSPNTAREQRYNLVENNISLSNEQNMRSWQAEQVSGAVGCKGYDGGLVCQDGLYSVNRYGLALTTMTMEYNSQIRTTYVSDPIKPVFVDSVTKGRMLEKAVLLELDGVIYMAFGDQDGQGIDNVLFCYDIDLKAWWTYTLDVDSPIINMFHVDWEGQREGIGIITADSVYLLPTTVSDDASDVPSQSFLIETAKLSTVMPRQGWHYLSQLEFHFDRFVGTADITLRAYDMFGREITITKKVTESEVVYDHVVHMRVDQRLMSYVITMSGQASFRMTHFMARVYVMPNKVGQVWGFDDKISHRSAGSVHPTFKDYNDVRRAIFT